MRVSEIIKLLPEVMDWMVLFNLSALERLFEDITIKKMFFIPDQIALERFSHAILTPEGTFLAPLSGSWPGEKNRLRNSQPDRLIRSKDGKLTPRAARHRTLADRFALLASVFPVDEADCLGLGEIPGLMPPVLLHLRIEDHCGQAKAVFAQEPSQHHYELLRGVGVSYLGGGWQDGRYLADFTVDLREHIFSGILSNFSRTGFCNAFFLQQGGIGQTLEKGLTEAARDRIQFARQKALEKAFELGQKTLGEPVPMTCQPPPPANPFDFGDLVPLGFLARCLKSSPRSQDVELGVKIGKYLKGKSRQNLWSFQSGDLPSATDSSLVLLGFPDALHETASSIQALEAFSDGEGGYFPQLWKSSPEGIQNDSRARAAEVDSMAAAKWNEHWCQTDYGTTCLVRFHRRKAGLPSLTPLNYLERGFGDRSSLFFANPYLVDWALAMGLAGDRSHEAGLLRERLEAEILAGMLPDFSFGTFDQLFSSALAVLSLACLGYRGRALMLARMSLAEHVIHDTTWPVSAPFYSTLRLPDTMAIFYRSAAGEPGSQVVEIGGDVYLISYYLDKRHVISAAATALALAEDIAPVERPETSWDHEFALAGGGRLHPEHSQSIEVHPRYRCANPDEYVAHWALPAFAIRMSGKSS